MLLPKQKKATLDPAFRWESRILFTVSEILSNNFSRIIEQIHP